MNGHRSDGLIEQPPLGHLLKQAVREARKKVMWMPEQEMENTKPSKLRESPWD